MSDNGIAKLNYSSIFSSRGRDLIGVQNLMKKHAALLAELAGHDARIATVVQVGFNGLSVTKAELNRFYEF